MATTQANTAWGEVNAYIAEMNAGETFPAMSAMDDIGVVKDGTTSIETQDGEVLELKREGGILYDRLEKEATYTLNLTLIDIPEETATKLWDIDVTDPGKIKVKSTVSGKKFSVGFAAVKVPGSRTFEIPKCTIKMTPNYSSTEGWSCVLKISILQSDVTGVTFQFGEVA
jgi:hypothetical protein